MLWLKVKPKSVKLYVRLSSTTIRSREAVSSFVSIRMPFRVSDHSVLIA